MPTIEDLIKDLENLPAIIKDAIDRAVIGDGFDIAEINREQLLSGEDMNGRPLGQYADSTKAIRQRKGLQTDFIDLSFTGHSQETIGTKKISDNKYELDANPRWDQKRFPDALGIKEDNESKVTAIIVENIEANIEQKLGW